MSKSNRDSRESEAREHDIRENFPTYYESELESIAAQVKRPGEHLRWVNYAIRNERTKAVDTALRMGYTVVPKDRLPGYLGDAFGDNPIADKGIVVGDVILMRCDEELYKLRKNHQEKKTQDTLRMLRGVVDDRGTSYTGYQIRGF